MVSAVGGDPRLLPNSGLRKLKLPVATGRGTCIARARWRVEGLSYSKCLPLSRGEARLEPF